MIKVKTLQKLIDILLLSSIFLFPFSVNIAYISPEDIGHPILTMNLSISDLLIGMTLLLWIIKVILSKSFHSIVFPPFPVLLFIFIGILSFINLFSISDWLKDLIQLTEYLFLFYLLLLNNLKSIKIEFFNIILFLLTTIVLIIALIQYSFLDGSPYLIRGLFENRNLLGLFLSIVLPIVFNELINTPSILKKVWMSILVVISLFVILSGSTIVTLIISLLVMSLVHSKKRFIYMTIILIIVGFLYSIIMPKKNKEIFKDTFTIYERGSISENYYERLTILNDLNKKPLFQKHVGENSVVITSSIIMPSKMPKIREGEAYKSEEGKRHIKNYYLEMLASLNLISQNTIIGVGLGNFQNQISSYYNGFQKINTSEPYVHNGYLIIGATTGVLGLSSFVWLLIFFLKKSIYKFRLLYSKSSGRNYFFLGYAGSIIAIIVQNFFTSILTAAIIPLFVVVLYCITLETE